MEFFTTGGLKKIWTGSIDDNNFELLFLARQDNNNWNDGTSLSYARAQAPSFQSPSPLRRKNVSTPHAAAAG